MNNLHTDLVIIGGGAAGLMAGCAAGEADLRTLILERKHKAGRKLLMCGNNRCNLSSNVSVDRMLEMFGPPSDSFLATAIQAFTPSLLQRWFGGNGLKTAVLTGNRIYPKSENASDVLHFFTDYLRDKEISIAYSSTVTGIKKHGKGFLIQTRNFEVLTRFVLIATGGISYPKTGSVGDGQNFARDLGHSIEPYRPGLVGVELSSDQIGNRAGQETIDVNVQILDADKNVIAETYGAWEFNNWGIEGSTISNATRIISRLNLDRFSLRLLHPNGQKEELFPERIRTIKEAMVTVGGVSLNEINSKTMESTICPGLYFAGEVMDVDGPTGGYNLHAAFATARLAVGNIAQRCGKSIAVSIPKSQNKQKSYSQKKTFRKRTR